MSVVDACFNANCFRSIGFARHILPMLPWILFSKMLQDYLARNAMHARMSTGTIVYNRGWSFASPCPDIEFADSSVI